MSACNLAPRGWRCLFEAGHDNPCGAVPRWWNLRDLWRFRGYYW